MPPKRSQKRAPVRNRVVARRLQVGGASATDIRQPTPGQSDQISISVSPVDAAFDALCSSFVLTSLVYGAPRASAANYLAAVKFILRNSMGDGARLQNKAPRIFWQIDNLLRPKKVTSGGITISYSFNIEGWTPTTGANLYGIVMGAPGAELVNTGLFTVSDAALPTITSPSVATDLLGEMFGFWQKKVPLIAQVNDYLFDASAFAWKTALFGRENPNDDTMSAYARVEHEVPITHWAGFCGLASNTCYGLKYDDNVRIPKFAEFVQGSACHHAGLRMFNPKYMGTPFARVKLNFAPVDLQQWFEVNANFLTSMSTRLVGAGRTGPGPSTWEAPEQYYANTVTKNLFLLYRFGMAIQSFNTFCMCWAGASSTGFAAVAVGTNNIDPTLVQGNSDWYYNVANARALKPTFNKRNKKVTIPYPVISEDAVAQWNIKHADLLQDSAPPNSFGGDDLDILNSNVSGTLVSLIDGLTIRDDFGLVAVSDGTYANINPTAAAMATDTAAPGTNIPVESTALVLPESSSEASEQIKKTFLFAQRDPTKALERFKRWEARKAVLVANREARKRLNVSGVMAAARTSPDTNAAIQIGNLSEVPFDTGVNLETMMRLPIHAPPSQDFPDALRLMFDAGNAIKSGLQVQRNYGIANVTQVMGLTKDPNSTQGSEVSTALLDMSKGLFESISPAWGPVLDSAIGAVGPRARAAVQVGGGIVQLGREIVQAVRQRRARKKAAQAQPKRGGAKR